ncbi:hypothetical protein L3Q82_026521, partial [Scortum barcoo]
PSLSLLSGGRRDTQRREHSPLTGTQWPKDWLADWARFWQPSVFCHAYGNMQEWAWNQGRVLAKSGRGTAHQRLAAISRGPHVSNSGQPWLQTGTLKQATTRPVIPVSTLVSGIDNGPIHLGPLKLAWHFKGEDREPGQPDTACKRVEPRKGGMGGKSLQCTKGLLLSQPVLKRERVRGAVCEGGSERNRKRSTE